MNRVIPIIIVLLVISLFLYLQAKRLEDPPIADETQFAEMSENIHLSGKPLCHFHGKSALYTTHPWLYPFFLSILRSGGITGYRLAGVVIYLATTIIALLIPKLTGMKPNNYYYLIGSALLLLTPISLSGVGLIDIDTALLPLMLVLSALSLLKLTMKDNPWLFTISIVIIALCGSTKLTTTLALIPFAIFLPHIFRHRFTFKPLLATLIGLGIAVTIYFSYTYPSSSQGMETLLWKMRPQFSPATIFKRLTLITLWFIPYLFISYISIWFFRLKRLHPALLSSTLLGLIIIIVYLFIGGAGYGFPKYHLVAIPLIVPALAYIASEEAIGVRKKEWGIILIGVAISLACSTIIGDYLLLPHTAFEDMTIGYKSIGEIRDGLIFQSLSMMLPLLVPTYFLILKRRLFIVATIVVGISFMVPQALFMADADYSIRYNYGERGFRDVCGIADALKRGGRLSILPGDVAYNIGIRGDYTETTALLNENALYETMVEKEGLYLILRASYINNRPWRDEARRVLKLTGDRYGMARLGHFIILLPKN